MKYASIIPLIGGETIAMERAFGKRPEYILSYSPFCANDEHLLNYYGYEVPYYLLDEDASHRGDVDVVNSVCPCAGLSLMSVTASSNNPKNQWMIDSTEHVLGVVKPTVLWGENAPALATKMGRPVVEKLRQSAQRHGYSMSLFKTKSLDHGIPQYRRRTFFFFWKGDRVPVFDYFKKERPSIENFIRGVKVNYPDPMSNLLVNAKTPSQDPFYRYVLQELNGGITHKEFSVRIPKSTGALSYINDRVRFDVVAKKLREWGIEREAAQCDRMQAKLDSGGGLMLRSTLVPKDYIGAFVGYLPHSITHPDEDRYWNVRECLAIMGMPNEFQLLNPIKSINHICQNVPVGTATDMAMQVKRFLDGTVDTIKTQFLIQDNHNQKIEYETERLTEFMA